MSDKLDHPQGLNGNRKTPQAGLLDALREVLTPIATTPGFHTAQEIAVSSGRSIGAVRKELHLAAAEGRLEVVRVNRPSLDGRSVLVPAYRVQPAKRGKTAKRVARRGRP